jgi:hypothetical protein
VGIATILGWALPDDASGETLERMRTEREAVIAAE